MPIAVALKSVDVSRRKITRHYEGTMTGAYTTGGDTLNLSAGSVTNPNGLPRRTLPPLPLPTLDQFAQQNCPGGYDFEILPNTVAPTLSNFLIKFYSSGATEIAASAYPALLLAGKIEFSVTTPTKTG